MDIPAILLRLGVEQGYRDTSSYDALVTTAPEGVVLPPRAEFEAAWLEIEAERLAATRAAALAHVDTAAEAARLRYVTAGVYQSEEYRRAAAEAERLLASAIAGSAALQVDVDAGTLDPRSGQPVTTQAEAAALVLWRRDQWLAALDAIRAVRLKAKADVATAGDAEAVQAILDALTWPEPMG